jgi:hypothetical protein
MFKDPTTVTWVSAPVPFINNQVANYNANAADANSIITLAGNHTVTLPTAVGITGQKYTVMCKTAGTNGILTTSGQTFLGYGNTAATSWTNSVVGRSSQFVSDGANWIVIKSDN